MPRQSSPIGPDTEGLHAALGSAQDSRIVTTSVVPEDGRQPMGSLISSVILYDSWRGRLLPTWSETLKVSAWMTFWPCSGKDKSR